MPAKRIALSFSAWKDADCPFRFNALRIAKTCKEPVTDAMRIGGEVATILKEYRTHCLKAGLPTDSDWVWQRMETGSWSLTDPERTRELLKNFFAKPEMHTVPIESPFVMPERKFAFDGNLNVIRAAKEDDAWFDKSVAFRMIPDLVYRDGDTLVLEDDKTGWGDPDPLQLKISSYLITKAIPPAEMGGVWYVQPVFNLLATGRKERLEPVRVDEMGEVKQMILDRIAMVNAWTEYPASECDACTYCTVPGCPLKADVQTALMESNHPVIARERNILQLPKEITGKLDATQALCFVVFANKIIGHVQKMLEDYLLSLPEEEAQVVGAGKIAQLKTQERWSTNGNLEGVIKTLIAYGAPRDLVFENLSLTGSALEKICRKAGIQERLNLIKAMGKTSATKPSLSITANKADY